MIHIQLSQEPLDNMDTPSGDCKAFSLVISQQEGQAALAELTFVAGTQLFPWCAIAEDKHLLFIGQLVGVANTNAQTLHATYRACRAMPTPLQHMPYDPLFFDEPHMSQYLEASPYLYYFDRCTGLPELSHTLNGSKRVTLHHVLKAEARTLHTPYSAVRATVDVEWVQKHEGTFDLAPSLHAACEGGQLHTLTPKALMHAWPQEGPFLSAQRGKHNGYTVVESHVECEDRSTPEPHHPTWLKGHIWVHWRYAQKRLEIVQFEVAQKLPPLWRSGHVHHIKWKLQAVDDAGNPAISTTASSFYNTERGQNALRYAVQLAHHHLHMSRRCLETTLTVPFSALASITLDHNIDWENISGKVASYRFVYTHKQAYGEVNVRHAVPCEDEAVPQIVWSPIQPEGLGDAPPPTMVGKLEIHNPAQDQLAYLALGGTPQHVPATKFFIRLLELGQHQTLVEKVDLGSL